MSTVKKLNTKAVIIGWLVDIAGSFMAGIFISIVAAVILTARGVSPDQITEELSGSKVFWNISLFTGFSFTFLGGYISAFIADSGEIKHALIVGILSLITGLLLSSITQPPESNLFLISIFVIPFAVLGGYFRKITKKDKQDKRPHSL